MNRSNAGTARRVRRHHRTQGRLAFDNAQCSTTHGVRRRTVFDDPQPPPCIIASFFISQMGRNPHPLSSQLLDPAPALPYSRALRGSTAVLYFCSSQAGCSSRSCGSRSCGWTASGPYGRPCSGVVTLSRCHIVTLSRWRVALVIRQDPSRQDPSMHLGDPLTCSFVVVSSTEN